MIEHVSIANFRCIQTLEMDLEPLTVLVGPNASGKSTVLAALARELRGAGGHWAISLRSNGQDVNYSQGSARARTHQFVLERLRQPNAAQAAVSLTRDGGNLANVFATLPRKTQGAVAQELCRTVDVFADVDVRPVANTPGHHRIVFQDRWDETRWFEPTEVSDGTMLMLAYLVMQHETQGPETIMIEEPERGLHPYLIGELMRLLRSISNGDRGRKLQFILATQSAELLDHVEPHEVRFLERDEQGGVRVKLAPTEDEGWAEAIEQYQSSVGQMWLSGSLGGVPGTQ